MKKSDIIADALGTLDEKTLTVPDAPEEERSPHILPRILAFGAFMLALVISLPFLRAHFAQAPADDPGKQTESSSDTEKNKNGSELVFTTEGQPASEPSWRFSADKVIDDGARPYFPDPEGEDQKIVGHNSAVYAAYGNSDGYYNGLIQNGFTRMSLGVTSLFYKDGVIIRTYYNDNSGSLTVNVYLDSPSGLGVAREEALEMINGTVINYADDLRGVWVTAPDGSNVQNRITCALEATTEGFYKLTGMQIFIVPFLSRIDTAQTDSIASVPYPAVFFVNENGAVRAGMNMDIDTCLSVDGRYGGPILCDVNGDQKREMLMLTPYHAQNGLLYFTVYDTGTPSELVSPQILSFSADNQRLLYTESGQAVIRSYSDDGKIDEYLAIGFDNGGTAFYCENGMKADPDLCLDTQTAVGHAFKTLDRDDTFVVEELISEKTSLTMDHMIKRLLFNGLKVFDVGGKKWAISTETFKDIRLFEITDGEMKESDGYRFKYNSLAMVYFADSSDGRNVYTKSGFGYAQEIYRYDLLTGDVYSFIYSAGNIAGIHYTNGMILYITSKDSVYTLKAAVPAERRIYRIADINTDPQSNITTFLTDGGAFTVEDRRVFFTGIDGETKKLSELSLTGTTLYKADPIGKLYAFDKIDNILVVIGSDGSVITRDLAVNGPQTGGLVKNDCAYGIEICNGALVSSFKNTKGYLCLYLYRPDTDEWEDISPKIDGEIDDYSFCVDGDEIYIMASGKERSYFAVYSPDGYTLLSGRSFSDILRFSSSE